MTDQEPNLNPGMNPNEIAARENERSERLYKKYSFDVSANSISYLIDNEDTAPDLGSDLVSYYLLCQISPHGGTELSGWEFGNVLGAISNRGLENQWLREHTNQVQGPVNAEFGTLTSDPVLESALTKQGLHEYIDGKVGVSPDMTDDEMLAYGKLQKSLKSIKMVCGTCGDIGRTLDSWVDMKREQTIIDLVMRSGEVLDEDLLYDMNDRLEELGEGMTQVTADIRLQDMLMRDPDAQTDTGEWITLLKGAVGANEVFSTCKQWLTNQSDLDPISKLWVYMGRMSELHPSALEAMAKEWPTFNDAFIGVNALGSGKYALGSNGEVYISGRYGMGFVDTATGKLVDMDKAVTRDTSGKKNGLRNGILELGLNQIYVPGTGAVNVVDNKITLGQREVAIFSKNILYLEKVDGAGNPIDDIRKSGREVKLKDSDVTNYLNELKEFVKGRNTGVSEAGIELSVELAREVYEFSMLSNWNGVPRDSEGRPYYTLNNDPLTMSSDPESQAVKMGYLAAGTDESSLFPYWNGGDWGKLTLTRSKQMEELRKGRKHGIYTVIPFLPENIVKPLFSKETLDSVMSGQKKMEEIFGDMNANEHFKTYWLDIFKGCSLYDFVASSFIGDKDPTKAEADLISLFMQPRLLESVNKDIDLSLFWVDKMEAARLKVNIVLGGLASVAKEFSQEELFGVSPEGLYDGRLSGYVADVKEDNLSKTADVDKYKIALRQLIASRFIGDEKEVMKVIERLKGYKEGKTALGFSMADFRATFGNDYLSRYEKSKTERRDIVASRSSKKK